MLSKLEFSSERLNFLRSCWNEHVFVGRGYGSYTSNSAQSNRARWATINDLAVWSREKCQRTGKRLKFLLLTSEGRALLDEWEKTQA